MSKVTQWSFENGGCAAEERRVWYLCAFSDGHMVEKAHLYDFRGVVEEGGSYILKGYNIVSNPPRLAVQREATFYNTTPIVVSQELEEAQRIAFPESRRTPLQHRGPSGLATLVGRVVEISTVRRAVVKRETVPVRNVWIEQDGCRATLSLWREATTWEVRLGQMAIFTHLTSTVSPNFGQQWSTGNYSTMEEETEVIRIIKVIGASILERKEVEILLEDLDVHKVAADVWEVICPQRAYPISLKVKTKAGWIVCAEAEAEE
ncbi:hypothetical protein SKAU_G00210840 [Synaphobranchus kaupii]|uniref:Uncharacterized protein n=1 Tax=Synaphobranchus kaupii TaxID=118154 RepID=A0A9Q1F922_SYNKA|nr:hypothetical protein SKAU_G00210840 [Synaphobranchus kaupii]